jgi:hypothetical protein
MFQTSHGRESWADCIPRCSQDVVIFVLFPYLLPSIRIRKGECWLKKDIRNILEKLLLFYCSIPIEKTQELLETFIRRELCISSNNQRSLDKDLYFLTNIENRCSFKKSNRWKSTVYSLYASRFLIQQGVPVDKSAFIFESQRGYNHTVALLLESKANVHEEDDYALLRATQMGHKDTVALLLKHKADVHADNERALLVAVEMNYKEIVALLIEHKANTDNERALLLAAEMNYKNIVSLLLEHKAKC